MKNLGFLNDFSFQVEKSFLNPKKILELEVWEF